MMPEKFRVLILLSLFSLVFGAGGAAASESAKKCPTLEKDPVKVEGWINRKYYPQRRQIAEEFEAPGNIQTRIKIFRMGKTAKVVAVGPCVPAPLARHVLEKALKYTGGIESLVQQAFLHVNWIGIGTTMFDEPSQQKVTPEQVQALLDPDLTTEEFHKLYRKFSIQDDEVPYFGTMVPNAKKADSPDRED